MPDEPHIDTTIPTPGDDDLLLSGETATTGTDEAEPARSSQTPANDEPDRVDLARPDAAAYWARHFQVTVERMHEAVSAVGDDPRHVAAHLGKPWPYEGSGIV